MSLKPAADAAYTVSGVASELVSNSLPLLPDGPSPWFPALSSAVGALADIKSWVSPVAGFSFAIRDSP